MNEESQSELDDVRGGELDFVDVVCDVHGIFQAVPEDFGVFRLVLLLRWISLCATIF